MKTLIRKQNRTGFTLIEMVGVLAVIAILAALLVPKIFAAINDSRFSNTVASINSVKAASMTYFGKYSKFGGVAGAAVAVTDAAPFTTFDNVLIKENMLETPFVTKIGATWTVQLANATVAANQYDIDGIAGADVTTGRVLQCVITGVDAADAYELSRRIDGESLSAQTVVDDPLTAGVDEGVAAIGAADTQGRVEFAAKDVNGKTTVRIYIANK
jgi:prepilin-type N-terminal cleavage/methylation domain-containing protein